MYLRVFVLVVVLVCMTVEHKALPLYLRVFVVPASTALSVEHKARPLYLRVFVVVVVVVVVVLLFLFAWL